MYKHVRQLMHFDCVRQYFPAKWVLLVEVKSLYYKATANYLAGLAILHATDKTLLAGLQGAFKSPNKEAKVNGNTNPGDNTGSPKVANKKELSLVDLFEPLRQKISSDLVLSEEGIIESIEVTVNPHSKLEDEYSHKLLGK